jgi:hypothetical protein
MLTMMLATVRTVGQHPPREEVRSVGRALAVLRVCVCVCVCVCAIFVCLLTEQPSESATQDDPDEEDFFVVKWFVLFRPSQFFLFLFFKKPHLNSSGANCDADNDTDGAQLMRND